MILLICWIGQWARDVGCALMRSLETLGGLRWFTESGEGVIGVIVLQEQNRTVAQATKGSQDRVNRADKVIPRSVCK